MSLFNAKDWWRAECGSAEELSDGAMCIGNVDNSADGQGTCQSGALRGASRLCVNAVCMSQHNAGAARSCIPSKGNSCSFSAMHGTICRSGCQAEPSRLCQSSLVLCADKVVTGSLQGMLRIYHPMERDFKVEHLLLEADLQQPILQLEAGPYSSYVSVPVPALQSAQNLSFGPRITFLSWCQ